MATLIVKHRVSNFETWQAGFDQMTSVRAKHGWISHRVLRDATDPNLITIINRVKDLASAKQYGASPELRDAMQRLGVQGVPEISLAEDGGEHTY